MWISSISMITKNHQHLNFPPMSPESRAIFHHKPRIWFHLTLVPVCFILSIDICRINVSKKKIYNIHGVQEKTKKSQFPSHRIYFRKYRLISQTAITRLQLEVGCESCHNIHIHHSAHLAYSMASNCQLSPDGSMPSTRHCTSLY